MQSNIGVNALSGLRKGDKMISDCNKCKHLNMTEKEQRETQLDGDFVKPHICNKYNKQVVHGYVGDSNSVIHWRIQPLAECTNNAKREIIEFIKKAEVIDLDITCCRDGYDGKPSVVISSNSLGDNEAWKEHEYNSCIIYE